MLEEDILMYCHSCPQFMLIIMSYKWEIILPSSLPACAKSYLRIDYFAMSCRSTFITVFHSSCEVPVQATADQTAPRPPRRRGELRLKLFDCHINVISSIVKRQMLLCFMLFYRARFCSSSQYCAPQFFFFGVFKFSGFKHLHTQALFLGCLGCHAHAQSTCISCL